MEYIESICKCFEARRGEESVEDRWTELQKEIVDSQRSMYTGSGQSRRGGSQSVHWR